MEDFENTYVGKLWNIVLSNDKRSFNEYFSEDFGITLDDCITDDQLFWLCKRLMYLSEHKIDEINTLNENFIELTKYND